MAKKHELMSTVARGALLFGLVTFATVPKVLAADATNIGTVNAQGGSGDQLPQIDQAEYQAPSQTPIDATEPTSLVTQHFIENSIVQTGNYDDAIKFTPSFTNVEPNGPGLQESKFINMRGFQDGQYNLTYDGIPLAGSPTSFHHESAVYFMENDLGGMQIDRGPGTASTVGNATFGGTLNIVSKDPSSNFWAGPYGTFGSFNTKLEGAELNTGTIDQLNGASLRVDVQHMDSDGFLTDSNSRRNNAYVKGIVPLNDTTTMSFVVMDNATEQHVPSGATLAEISQNYNFGLNNNPKSNNYWGYNQSTYATNLEYIGLQSDLGDGWKLDNKVYQVYFSHINVASTKNNDDAPQDFSNLSTSYDLGGAMLTKAQIASGAYTNQILGTTGKQDFNSWGDIMRLSKDLDIGQLRFGVWGDITANSYNQEQVDLSAGGLPYVKCSGTSLANCPSSGAWSYLLHDTANTYQAYTEFEWHPVEGLSIIPGFKYASYRMSEDAIYNSSTKLPFSGTKEWDAPLPSLEANYLLLKNWSVYAQVAEGNQAPPLNAFFANSIAAIPALHTWNYQAGTVYKTGPLLLSADVYYIEFTDFYSSYKDANNNTLYFSAGPATYKGVEFEGTYHLGYHLSLYGNLTYNNANYQNGVEIANAPNMTAALGLIYQDNNGFYGSLMGKEVGSQYGSDNATNTNAPPTLVDNYELKPYHYVDLAVGYDFKNDTSIVPFLRGARISFKINNVLDEHARIGYAGNDGGTNLPLYWVMPDRSFWGSLTLKF